MHNPDEPPQNPILHLIEFGHAVLDFKIAMTAEPKDWRDHCRNLQDAWAKTSNVDIQRLPVDALYRIRSLRENQNKTHKHDGRGAPSAFKALALHSGSKGNWKTPPDPTIARLCMAFFWREKNFFCPL
jgi:hypothetical protein